MFDVDKLKEAVEAYEEWGLPGFIEFAQDNYNATVTLFAAARMVAAGQPLWWCEVHKAERWSRNKCLTWHDLKALEYEPISTCRIVEGWWMPTGKDET